MTKKNHPPQRQEILFTGFGGQGIVLAGRILGEAAVIGDHKESTLVQAYGPEARGGACSAQVIIANGVIHYPYVRNPDVLVCMSQGGFDKFFGDLKENGTLIIDQDLVNPHSILPRGRGAQFKIGSFAHTPYFAIPATRMAEELGRKMMANIIMLGFFTAITGAISVNAARNSVTESVPKGTEKMNIKAFTKGYDYGLAVLKGRKKKASGNRGA
jgi:2-oxoglutarate ferredoxin oxidoreductase subunit gamma